MKRLRYSVCCLLVALCLVGTWGLSSHSFRHPPAQRFGQQVYVWQMHWNEAVHQAIDQSEPYVDGFMLLAGELGYDGKEFLFLPASSEPRGISKPITIVLRMRSEFSKTLAQHRAAAAIEFILGRLAPYLSAKYGGPARPGVQIDYDCPTAALVDYADFLKAMRAALPETTFSITTLPDWFHSDALTALLAQVDFYVLQVHSLEIPKTIDTPYTLCDPEKARSFADRGAAMGIPYYVALPTYSYRMLFDGQGRFRSIVAEQTTLSPPPGWHAKNVSADPAALAGLVRGWREKPPSHCLGLAWFRLPVDGDRRNLPWPAFQSLMAGNAPPLSFAAEMRQPEPGLYELWLSNTGTYAPTSPVRCTVQWTRNAMVAYDVLGGYAGNGALGRDSVEVHGPAPEATAEPKLVGWFRVRPEFNEDKETVKCGAVHIVSPSGS